MPSAWQRNVHAAGGHHLGVSYQAARPTPTPPLRFPARPRIAEFLGNRGIAEFLGQGRVAEFLGSRQRALNMRAKKPHGFRLNFSRATKFSTVCSVRSPLRLLL